MLVAIATSILSLVSVYLDIIKKMLHEVGG